MKILFLLFLCCATISLVNAQRFFYVEKGTVAEKMLQQQVLQSAQYLAASPVNSDYIIKTESGLSSRSNNTTLKISLVDSASFKIVFEAEEKFATIPIRLQPQVFERMAFQTLIEKNIDQIMLVAKQNSFHRLIKSIDQKKDKT